MGKKKAEHVVSCVEEGSIAWELEIEPGDVLVAISGEPVEDVLDYHFLIKEEYLEVVIRKPDGEEWELEIEKDVDEDLGIEFENPLMDEYRSCRNRCIFCFIDQLPEGMRSTLYFKDDDSRLSFLQGNYVTLTNMSSHDIDRIIRYRLEPINISFHTMNPALRVSMLRNRFAGDIFPKVDRLYEAGIEMNGQIVLCRGVNDGEELEKSLAAFEKYVPHLKSVSVVPVGLTRFRDGLYPLESFTREDAKEVTALICKWQQYYKKKFGYHLVHASDEWYILGEEDIPDAETYDGYPQLENGVGMVRLFLEETREYLSSLEGDGRKKKLSAATGRLFAPFLRQTALRIKEKYPGIDLQVYEITNRFFGEKITVSGLITGQDLAEQLSGKDLGEKLLLPGNMLRSDETVFLDDMTVGRLEEILNTGIRIVASEGRDMIDACLEDPEKTVKE